MNRPARTLLRLAIVAVATCALAGEPAGFYSPSLSPGTSIARTIPHSDVVPTRARAARAASAWSGGPVTASTGEVVSVYTSTTLPVELGTPQTWADFLAGLVHGPELATLTVYIATLPEIQEICGEYSLGCYGSNRMAAIGETAYGITAQEVVRHEYGHHIALNRLNPPWTAIEWGPKNWASSASICARTAGGSVYPGDEGDHYHLNPGEAWAETYRVLDERKAGATGSGWQLVDPSFLPDELALQAAEQDVSQPWTAASKTVFRRTFTPKGKRIWTTQIATPLDGDLTVVVTLPRGGVYDVVLLDAKTKATVATGLWAGMKSKRITTTVCGARSLVLKISQRGAYGRVVATVERP